MWFKFTSQRSNNIETDANNVHSTVTLMSFGNERFPNKTIRIRPTEPSWINARLKRCIRKRKWAFKRVNRTNLENDWRKFRTLRNKTVSAFRNFKMSFYDSIIAQLSSLSLSRKDWWITIKSFINLNTTTPIPLLELNSLICIDEIDKANILNDLAKQS